MKFSVKLITILTGCLLTANALFAFNRQDTLRGSNGHGRDWWDVQHYSLSFYIDTANRSIGGTTTIEFKITDANISDSMQIDLQEPMELSEVHFEGNKKVNFVREGNVYWIMGFKEISPRYDDYKIKLSFKGKPRQAVNPPWDGGFIWTKDSLGNPWISVACQGLGASSWWPCKDFQGDEPDRGMEIDETRFYYRSSEFISNGKKIKNGEIIESVDIENCNIFKDTVNYWKVRNPINTYNATFYLGDYVNFTDQHRANSQILKYQQYHTKIRYKTLHLNYFVLRYHENQAREHFKQVTKMLEAFEYWFGPYPFYEDGYKIVEAPFLGMEHQSAIAYGNEYKMGYRGKDRSGTGVGLLFDFIIVHESGHEWFGNSITAADIADNWIHEGFTTYSETLFAEYWFGKEKAFEYSRGEWKNISNDRPVIGNYGVNDAGSGDKYDKGSALVHTIRLLMNDDERFRAMLHKMNDTFYHKQISTKQMEDFIIGFSGLPLQPIFEQYLRTTMIPELQYKQKGSRVEYRWVNVVDGFELPIPASMGNDKKVLIVSADWQKTDWKDAKSSILFPPNFLHSIKMLP